MGHEIPTHRQGFRADRLACLSRRENAPPVATAAHGAAIASSGEVRDPGTRIRFLREIRAFREVANSHETVSP
jgi:hypothetical protein